MRPALFRLCVLTLAATIGCGGGSSSGPGVATSSSAGRAVLTLTIPPKTAASTQRRADFVSPSTQSVSIVVNTSPAQITNVGPTNSNCTTGSNGTTCTITVSAPVGSNTFTVTLYDGQNATGNVLGMATASGNVVAGQAFVINVTAVGQPKSVQITMTPIAPGQVAIGARALDAGGNAIAGSFPSAVTLAASGSLPVTLSGTSIPDSKTTVTATYTFSSTSTATVTATLGSSTATGTLPLSTQQSFPIPTASADPFIVTVGPDGNAWFGELGPLTAPNPVNGLVLGTNAKIARITSNGTITEFPLPQPNLSVDGLTAAPDGNLWAGQYGNLVRMTTSGVGTSFPVPFPSPARTPYPRTPTVGPDGNIWYADQATRSIGRSTLAGQITEFPIPRPPGDVLGAQGITAGPDGALWFTAPSLVTGNDQIGRITTSGAITLFPAQANTYPRFIVTGSDGNLWYSSSGPFSDTGQCCTPGVISRITTSGTVTNFSLPFPLSQADSITAGPDGAIWFVDFSVLNSVGRMTTSGVVDEYPLTTANNSLGNGLAFTSDGALWVVDSYQNTVVKMVSASGWIPLPANLLVNGTDPTQPALFGIYESGNSGPFTVTIADNTIAKVALVPGTTKTYGITGVKAGTTSLVVVDAKGRAAVVPVTVTTTTGTLQSVNRAARKGL